MQLQNKLWEAGSPLDKVLSGSTADEVQTGPGDSEPQEPGCLDWRAWKGILGAKVSDAHQGGRGKRSHPTAQAVSAETPQQLPQELSSSSSSSSRRET